MQNKDKIVRRWLNPISSNYTGYVQFCVYRDTQWPSISLKLADCSRIVSFDFDDVHTKRGKRAAIKKLSILRDSVQELITDVENI